MITERTLKKWRKESLVIVGATNIKNDEEGMIQTNRSSLVHWHQRILQMTQELLDQHLLNKE